LLNPWVLAGALVAAIVIGAGGYHLGARVTAASYEADIIKAQQQKALDDAAVAASIDKTAATWAEKWRFAQSQLQVAENTHRIIYRNIKEKVPVYVTPKADAACIVPNGFVVLYDAAVSGNKPESVAAAYGVGPGDVDRPSGIPLSKIGSVSVDNADACSGWHDKLETCRAYVNTVTGFYNDLRSTVHVCK
jgi:hypothetical protein